MFPHVIRRRNTPFSRGGKDRGARSEIREEVEIEIERKETGMKKTQKKNKTQEQSGWIANSRIARHENKKRRQKTGGKKRQDKKRNNY
jgi:hypothetical protein